MQNSALTPAKIARLTRQFEQCKIQLLELSWITQGSIFETQQGTWCWTRKVKAKTVTVALSAQQAELFKQAVAQNRKLETLLNKMRAISQTFLLQSVPGPLRRKRSKPS
jgi:biotin synthase-related radical SAM superfamily protein